MADRFFIAPYDSNSGLQTDVRPFLIPDEAFSEMKNAYVFRSRVRKRFGSRWLGDNALVSRLRSILVPAGLVVTTPSNVVVGQQFSIGTDVFTVTSIAFPVALLSTSAVTATLSAANQVTFSAISTSVYWYPNLPAMGLLTYEQSSINDEIIIGFDTKYSYLYSGGWERITAETTAGAATWTGSNAEFFWGTTWTGVNAADKIFFVTNFNENEPNFIRYYNGTVWDNFRPQLNNTVPIQYINSARVIVPFKNRLVMFNTWEGNTLPGTNYSNRCRYSQIGSPLDALAWRQDLAGRGNAIDCPTTEAITTVEFLKDRLIVSFERSTWELVYTGNQVAPFAWQQINTELGAESTFSVVPFDKVAIAVGNVGIHACNGSNVDRIDNKIPDTVFDIHNANDGIYRVYGIRDYFVEMIYWTFPNTEADSDYPYPNRVLVYSYKSGTWSFNDDSITCFGYFQPTNGVTWDSQTVTWNDSVTWDSGAVQAKFRQVIAGNQQGYTFICDSEVPTNAAVLQITNIITTPITTLTVMQHNLNVGDFIYIQDAVYSDASDGLNDLIFEVIGRIDPDTIEIGPLAPFTGTYLGGGLISRVSKISITTKQYNFYAKQGRNAYISKVDFMVSTTSAGQMQVNFFVSTSAIPLLQESAANGVLLGTGTLDTFAYTLENGTEAPVQFEKNTTRVWHPVYFQADGEVIQLQLVMNDEQMQDVDIRESNFELHAMCITAQPTSNRFQ